MGILDFLSLGVFRHSEGLNRQRDLRDYTSNISRTRGRIETVITVRLNLKMQRPTGIRMKKYIHQPVDCSDCDVRSLTASNKTEGEYKITIIHSLLSKCYV